MATKYKKLCNKLTKVFNAYIRKRDGKCIICESTENLNAGHYISRHYLAYRWDEINVNGQCASCNKRHMKNPVPYTIAMINKYGIKSIEYLNKKDTLKMPIKFLTKQIELYSDKLENM